VKKVIFYTEAQWAFGSIHTEFCRYLFNYGINGSLLDWKIAYTYQEIQELDQGKPIWCTEPHAVPILRDFGIPDQRIFLIAHSVADVEWAAENIPEWPHRQFVVISKFLQEVARTSGLYENAQMQHIGTNTYDFVMPSATELRRVGYAGTMRPEYQTNKRPELIQQVCERTGLEFVVAETYHNSFVTMPGFYRSVDCVVVASQHEGDGMISLEAAASGRMVISTPVGHWPELCSGGGGLDLPVDAEALVDQLTAYLTMYRDNPTLFAYKCANIQSYSQRYNWERVAPQWAKLMSL
jgi:hypothetical protein